MYINPKTDLGRGYYANGGVSWVRKFGYSFDGSEALNLSLFGIDGENVLVASLVPSQELYSN